MFMNKNIKITLNGDTKTKISYELFTHKCASKDFRKYMTQNLDVSEFPGHKLVRITGGRKARVKYYSEEIVYECLSIKGESITKEVQEELGYIYYTDYYSKEKEEVFGIAIKSEGLKYSGFELEELLDIVTFSANEIICRLLTLKEDKGEITLELYKSPKMMAYGEARDYLITKLINESNYVEQLQAYGLDSLDVEEDEIVSLGTELKWRKLNIKGKKYFKRDEFLFSGKETIRVVLLDYFYIVADKEHKTHLSVRVSEYSNLLSQDIIEDFIGHLYYYRFY